MTKITMRETLERAMAALVYHQEQTRPIARTQIAIAELIAALAAQPAEPSMRPLPDHDNHHNALKCPYCNPRGLKFAEPAAAQPTGQSPCARHCEAPAFEGEIRRLKREATIKDSLTIRPPAPAAVPPGYVLVPIEPTPEMVDAGDVARHSVVTQARTSVIYRAMIAAAGDKT